MATDRERERKLEAERSKRARALPHIQRATAVEVTRLLKRAEKDIRSALAGAPSDYQAFVLPQLQASVRTALRTFGTGAGESLSRGAAGAFEAGIDTVERPLDAALGLDSQGDFRIAALLPQVDTSQLLAMRSFLTHKMTGVSVTLANRVNAELGLAIIGTRSVGETTGRVAALLKTGGRSRALTLIRTELGRAYSVAGQQCLEQAAEVLPGLKKQWRRSGKLRARVQLAEGAESTARCVSFASNVTSRSRSSPAYRVPSSPQTFRAAREKKSPVMQEDSCAEVLA